MKVFPAEFAARNTGHLINYPTSGSSKTCNDFISAIVPTPTPTIETNICNKWNFNTLETMRYFVNGTWFGTEAEIATETGLTDIQVTSFYDSGTGGSFGSKLQKALDATAVKYNCAGYTAGSGNCTTEELSID